MPRCCRPVCCRTAARSASGRHDTLVHHRHGPFDAAGPTRLSRVRPFYFLVAAARPSRYEPRSAPQQHHAAGRAPARSRLPQIFSAKTWPRRCPAGCASVRGACASTTCFVLTPGGMRRTTVLVKEWATSTAASSTTVVYQVSAAGVLHARRRWAHPAGRRADARHPGTPSLGLAGEKA